MSTIDQILFPILLFVVYSILAIQFLPQHSTVPKDPVNSIEDIVSTEGSDRALKATVISRDWLRTQSLANLKSIAAELCIIPVGDKRSKSTWIDAIAVSTPENTVLTVNLCYA
jgi:hypothetical protein